MWAARPHLANIFEKIVGSKNFHLPAARFFERSISAKAMFHMKQIKNCS